MINHASIAVVIPCYKVSAHVLNVIGKIGKEVDKIYVVDDCCPQNSGDKVSINCQDERVTVIRLPENQGVGGAVIAGYKAAIADDMTVIVKIDGDDQMEPSLIAFFVAPIIAGEADYTKGNRFFDLETIGDMPKIRLFGNSILSFMTKLSSGYWDIFDPTNGFTAIHGTVAAHLPFEKLSRRYFFETDMLFRLNTLRAVVVDIPMMSKYEDEISNLKISRVIGEFLFKHFRNFCKRVFYNYYLRDMSLASIELPLGVILATFGIAYGLTAWISGIHSGTPTTAGAVMLAALPVILGAQFILAFIGHDIRSIPNRAIHKRITVFGCLRKKSIL